MCFIQAKASCFARIAWSCSKLRTLSCRYCIVVLRLGQKMRLGVGDERFALEQSGLWRWLSTRNWRWSSRRWFYPLRGNLCQMWIDRLIDWLIDWLTILLIKFKSFIFLCYKSIWIYPDSYQNKTGKKMDLKLTLDLAADEKMLFGVITPILGFGPSIQILHCCHYHKSLTQLPRKGHFLGFLAIYGHSL